MSTTKASADERGNAKADIAQQTDGSGTLEVQASHNTNPATARGLDEVADASAGDAVHALELAADAQRRWADTASRVGANSWRRGFELL